MALRLLGHWLFVYDFAIWPVYAIAFIVTIFHTPIFKLHTHLARIVVETPAYDFDGNFNWDFRIYQQVISY